MRRITTLVAVCAIAAIGLVAQASPASSGAGGGPIGYSSGAEFSGFASCDFFAIDLSTGVAEPRNTDPVECADGFTFAPDGTLFAFRGMSAAGIGPPELITVDPSTGAQTPIGLLPTEAFQGSAGMTFDAAGNLWLYTLGFGDCPADGGAQWCLWSVNPTTAETELVGAINEDVGVYGLAATCSEVQAITNNLIRGPQPPSGSALARVDTATGDVTEIAQLPDVRQPQGLDYDSSGGLWAIGAESAQGGGNVTVYGIDPASGASQATTVTVGGDPFFGVFFGLAVSPLSCAPPPTPAPEVVLAPTFTG